MTNNKISHTFTIDNLSFVYTEAQRHMDCIQAPQDFACHIPKSIVKQYIRPYNISTSNYISNDFIFMYIFQQFYNREIVNLWCNHIYNIPIKDSGGDFPSIPYAATPAQRRQALDNIIAELHKICNMIPHTRSQYISNIYKHYSAVIALRDF